MKKVAHVYASGVKFNSGDYILGISTKQYFANILMKDKDKYFFEDYDCRSEFTKEIIKTINENYDYLLVGGGGLILPDSAPNMISCWQWVIHEDLYSKIKIPIYVVSIGYNLFYGQDITMSSRESNHSQVKRLDIFKSNIRKLINKAEHFTLRHTGDMESLISIIGEDMRDKISMEICPSVWYVKTYWKPYIPKGEKYIAIEIKDDREWRRYINITKQNFYLQLENFVKDCINNSIPIAYMSHDGSRNFYRYLQQKGINLPLLDNTSGDEEKIFNNYALCKTILCSAGHSQMMSHGLGIKTISLISHPKLRYFCDDINNNSFVEINDEPVYEKIKQLI
jgi:hypothetical protein